MREWCSVFAFVAAAALGGPLALPASAAVPVYGTPTYTPGVGGFQNPQPAGFGMGVNDAGMAIGLAERYDAANVFRGASALRWNSTGVTILGKPGPDPSSCYPSSINSAGVVVGFADTFTSGGFSTGTRAVRWAAGGTAPTILGDLGTDGRGVTSAAAHAINSAGTIVGSASKYVSGTDRGYRAVRWNAGSTVATELGSLGTGNAFGYLGADAVNEAGTAIGFGNTIAHDTNYQAIRWSASGTAATALGNLGLDAFGGHESGASAINSAGTVVGGVAKYVAGVYLGDRPVRWDASGTAATELDNLGTTPAGLTVGNAQAVNDAGTSVGLCEKYDAAGNDLGSRATRWSGSGTGVTELGNLGTDANGSTHAVAVSIDMTGAAVGWAEKYDFGGKFVSERATYWGADGLAVDLNTLIDPASGWTLERAYSMSSNTNWITGVATFDPDGFGGQALYGRLFLIQIPEPTGFAALLGAAAVARLRSRKATPINIES